jgi:hypothetical protein
MLHRPQFMLSRCSDSRSDSNALLATRDREPLDLARTGPDGDLAHVVGVMRSLHITASPYVLHQAPRRQTG